MDKTAAYLSAVENVKLDDLVVLSRTENILRIVVDEYGGTRV
jgi:hypothetical protein